MPCRVGISTRPEQRKSEWEREVIGMTNWKILGKYPIKKEAQEHENRYARTTGCKASHGGPHTPGTWYVYRFDYTRSR